MPEFPTKYIGVLDLETTGSEILEGHEIIELGLVVVDPDLGEPLLTINQVLAPQHERSLEMLKANDFVREMHEANGLLPEVETCFKMNELTAGQYDSLLASTLINKFGTEHIALAGSGVAHFDNKYLAQYMPLTRARFTYWTLDVGVFRRTMQLFDIDTPYDREKEKTHRALDDALWHLEELRLWKDHIRQLM